MHCPNYKKMCCLLIGQLFRHWCQHVLNISVWGCGCIKKKNASSNCSCTATFWMIVGFVCRPVPVTLRVRISTEKKPSSVINQIDCGVFFIMHCMKVLVHRIQSCFYDLCHRVCELQMSYMDKNAAVFCCNYCWWCSCENWTGNCVADVSNLVPVVSSFSQHISSACSLPDYSGTCCSEPCHIFMNCCPAWNRHIRRFSS